MKSQAAGITARLRCFRFSLLFSLRGRKINAFQISALKISQMDCNYRPICCQIVESPAAEMCEDLPSWSLLSSPGFLPTAVMHQQPSLPLGSPLGGESTGRGARFAHRYLEWTLLGYLQLGWERKLLFFPWLSNQLFSIAMEKTYCSFSPTSGRQTVIKA